MSFPNNTSDIINFSKMANEEKENLIENICQRQLNLAHSICGISGFIVKCFIENIDVNKIKEKVVRKLSG